MEMYVGKQPDGQYKISNTATDVVMRLVEPIKGSGRNITADNWFSTIPLARKLLQARLTCVGTLRKNKKEIPPKFISARRKLNSSLFGFRNDMTLVSYVPKN